MNRFEFSPPATAFQKQAEIYLPEGSKKLIAGISGGPDSMALLYILHRLNIQTIAVHCNYGLRGDASDLDQKLVEEMCILWNIDCVSVRLETDETDIRNFQAWARDQRYQIFKELLSENGYDFIATAHHRDDQIETILQKILRGAGLASWKGMDVFDGALFRPLLSVKKSEIMHFLHDLNVPYRIDSSNEESTYARNFIRNNWFPDLNRLFPGWKKNLLEIPNRAAEFSNLVHYVTSRLLTESGAIKRTDFLQLDASLWPVILHSILQKKFPDIHVSRNFLENLSRLQSMQTGTSITITKGLSIFRDRDLFEMIKEGPSIGSSFEILLNDIQKGVNLAGFRFTSEEVPEIFNPKSLHIDISNAEFPFRLRKWKNGDSFKPFGLKGTQLISDHLTNRKIPSSVKRDANVIETFDQTICAVIFPIDSGLNEIGTISDAYRCIPSTNQTLTIRKII